MGSSPPDRPLPRMWTQVINAPFEEDDAQLGLQTMRDYFASGYKPDNVHIHILILVALGRAPRQPDAAALASQSVMILHDLLSITYQASSLASSIPTCVRGSAEAVIDYDPQHYPLLNAAKRMMSNARSGFWDIILETKGARRRRRKRLQEEVQKDPTAEICKPLGPIKKRGRKTNNKFPRKDAAMEEQGDDIHEEDDDTEVVSDRTWMVIDWMIKVWEKEVEEIRRTGNEHAYSPLFLAQIPPKSSYEPQWDISRIVVVISSAFEEGDSYVDPSWTVNEMSKHAKLALAGRLISLALYATLTSPRALLSPPSLTYQLTLLCLGFSPHQIELFFAVIPKAPHALLDNVVLGLAREVVGLQNNAGGQGLRDQTSDSRVVKPAGQSSSKIVAPNQSYPEVSVEDVESLIAACKGFPVEAEDVRARLTVVGAQLEGIVARLRHS